MTPPHERFFHGSSCMICPGESASFHAPRGGRVSHGASFLRPWLLARRRLAREIHHHQNGETGQDRGLLPWRDFSCFHAGRPAWGAWLIWGAVNLFSRKPTTHRQNRKLRTKFNKTAAFLAFLLVLRSRTGKKNSPALGHLK